MVKTQPYFQYGKLVQPVIDLVAKRESSKIGKRDDGLALLSFDKLLMTFFNRRRRWRKVQKVEIHFI